MKTHKITELLGDGISPELSQSVHAVLKALPIKFDVEQIDLSLEGRKKEGKGIYHRTLSSMQKSEATLKYPTTTEKESPNKILRELCNFAVIHRPCVTIPGVPTNFKKNLDIDIIRVATGGTYEDAGRRIGLQSAVSIRVIEWIPSLLAARYALQLAQRRKRSLISASKYTIQRETDGLFEEAVTQAAQGFEGVKHERVLFDALLAKLIMKPEEVQVVVCPNEYGDFLSDLAAGLVGSLGLADSANYAFREDGSISLAMFDPAGGTAPDIAGKNLANPTAALLALCTMLCHLGETELSEKLKAAILGCLERGERTKDLGGKLGTDGFTDAVIRSLGTVAAR